MPFTLPVQMPQPTADLLPGAEGACTWVRRVAVLLALLFGGSNLLIWMWGAVPHIPWWPQMMVMRMNTGVGISAAALSLACWSREPGPARVALARSLALIVTLIGGLTAMQDVLGVNLRIDEFFAAGFMPGDRAGAFVGHPGRMSLNAASSLFFLGLALLAMDWGVPVGKRRVCFAPALGLLAMLPTTLGLVGYMLGVGRFTGILSSTNILLHTALSLIALCVGSLAARPLRPPVRRILSTGADGVLLRWTLPGTAALLLTLGWIIERWRAHGLVVPGEGTAIMLYGGFVLLFGLLISASRAVARQESRARVAAEAVRRGQERSRAIIDTALDGMLLLDARGTVVDWNPAAERIFGWRREEMIGHPLAERLLPDELREPYARGLERYAETGDAAVFGRRLELSALHRDGAQFPVEISVNPLPNTDPALFVSFIRDITERQAAEENLRSAKEAAESASRAKDHFVAALSHELRTPLAPVLLSAAELREDKRLPADVREQLTMMERNISLEARLIDDLLDLTRISRGKLPLHIQPCDAHGLLSHAVGIVEDDARAKDITIALDFSAKHSGLEGDPARLQQVFWNLLKNGVKFTPPHGRILLQTQDDLTNECLIIEVSDTGVGFPSEAAERIFQPFEQAGREGDHRFGGLGLGLAIARAVVDLHGGILHASSPGVELGATFRIELPGATLPPQRAARPGGDLPAAAARPQRILLVEDHEPTLAVLSRLLQRAGHQVIPARNISAAQVAAESEPFDVLVSDLGLPDGTGVDLITALHARNLTFRSVALSGYGMEEDFARTRQAGFDAHLIKPVDLDQLRRTLNDLQLRSE